MPAGSNAQQQTQASTQRLRVEAHFRCLSAGACLAPSTDIIRLLGRTCTCQAAQHGREAAQQ
jgi:hypothetical protein